MATKSQTFHERHIQDFILERLGDALEIPVCKLEGLRTTSCVVIDPVNEMSYEAYKNGTLQDSDTLAVAKEA